MRSYTNEAKVFKAFCDESRLQIISLLRHGELCACKLSEALTIGQSTLSHHMKILLEAGIVLSRREGKWTHYTLNVGGCQYAIALISELSDSGAQSEDKIENICASA
jgi:ArsR family transcriptional regulator